MHSQRTSNHHFVAASRPKRRRSVRRSLSHDSYFRTSLLPPPLIDRLPTELLSEIFETVVLMNFFLHKRYCLTSLILVCHHWADVAFSTPRLWTRLRIHSRSDRPVKFFMPLILEWFGRSGSALPLNLSLKIPDQNSTFYSLHAPDPGCPSQLEGLKAVASRLATLRLRVPESDITASFSAPPGGRSLWSNVSWDQLVILSLELDSSPGSDIKNFFSIDMGHMPCLTKLTLETMTEDPTEDIQNWNFPWAQLVCLVLGPIGQAGALNILIQCPNLKECMLSLEGEPLEPESPQAQDIVTLPKLTQFWLLAARDEEGYVHDEFLTAFLKMLRLPALDSLTLCPEFPGAYCSYTAILGLTGGSEKSSITELSLCEVRMTDQDLVDLFRGLPELEILRIANHDAKFGFLQSGLSCDFLPKLGILNLQIGVCHCPATEATFLGFVRTRQWEDAATKGHCRNPDCRCTQLSSAVLTHFN